MVQQELWSKCYLAALSGIASRADLQPHTMVEMARGIADESINQSRPAAAAVVQSSALSYQPAPGTTTGTIYTTPHTPDQVAQASQSSAAAVFVPADLAKYWPGYK